MKRRGAAGEREKWRFLQKKCQKRRFFEVPRFFCENLPPGGLSLLFPSEISKIGVFENEKSAKKGPFLHFFKKRPFFGVFWDPKNVKKTAFFDFLQKNVIFWRFLTTKKRQKSSKMAIFGVFWPFFGKIVKNGHFSGFSEFRKFGILAIFRGFLAIFGHFWPFSGVPDPDFRGPKSPISGVQNPDFGVPKSRFLPFFPDFPGFSGFSRFSGFSGISGIFGIFRDFRGPDPGISGVPDPDFRGSVTYFLK